MKAKLQAKLRSRKGFTLVEMLIVVAIIAILVAISIPVVSSSLEKARVATDQANERAAKAVALIGYLTDDTFVTADSATKPSSNGDGLYYFDAEGGTLANADTSITGYGQSSDKDGKILQIWVESTGDVHTEWVDKTGSGG